MLVDGKRTTGRTPDGALWWISRVEGGRTEAMTVPCEGRQALAVFNREDEAQSFLLSVEFGGSEDGWRVRESRRGELTSLLYDPHTVVKQVALDPPPYAALDGTPALTSVDRRAFVEDFLARRNGTG